MNNIVVDIVATATAGGIITAVGFVFKQILAINERLARIEEHLGIQPVTEKTKTK